jgi:hypothetical protein
MSEDCKYIYHLGIIDYLQDFNMDKFLENKFKSMRDDGNLISAVPPEPYSHRFFNFMQNQVVINQRLGDNSREDVKYHNIAGRQKQSHYHKV